MALHRRTILGVLSSAVAISVGCTEQQPPQGCTKTPSADAMDDLTIGNGSGEAAHLRVNIFLVADGSSELVFEFDRNLVGDTSRTYREGIFTEPGTYEVEAWTDADRTSREFTFDSIDSLNRFHISISVGNDGRPKISSSHLDGC